MKNLLLLLVFPFSVFSQSLILNDLMLLKQKNVEDFGNYLEKRGWAFESTIKDNDYEQPTWVKSGELGISKSYCGLTIYKNSYPKEVCYLTDMLSDYNQIKDELNKAHFIYYGYIIEERTIHSYYYNDEYEIKITRSSTDRSTLFTFRLSTQGKGYDSILRPRPSNHDIIIDH